MQTSEIKSQWACSSYLHRLHPCSTNERCIYRPNFPRSSLLEVGPRLASFPRPRARKDTQSRLQQGLAETPLKERHFAAGAPALQTNVIVHCTRSAATAQRQSKDACASERGQPAGTTWHEDPHERDELKVYANRSLKYIPVMLVWIRFTMQEDTPPSTACSGSQVQSTSKKSKHIGLQGLERTNTCLKP